MTGAQKTSQIFVDALTFYVVAIQGCTSTSHSYAARASALIITDSVFTHAFQDELLLFPDCSGFASGRQLRLDLGLSAGAVIMTAGETVLL